MIVRQMVIALPRFGKDCPHHRWKYDPELPGG
jgi:hypothetical protein